MDTKNPDINSIVEFVNISEKVAESEAIKPKKLSLPSFSKEKPRGPKSPGLVPIKKTVSGKDKEGNVTSFDRTYYIDPHKGEGALGGNKIKNGGDEPEKSSLHGSKDDVTIKGEKKVENGDLLSSVAHTKSFDELGKTLTEKGYGDGEFEAIKTFACNL